MKPKTKNKTFYWTVAIICLIYGGIVFITFVNMSYFAYIRTQLANEGIRPERPFSILPLIFNFLGALVSITAGVSMISIIRAEESKDLKKELIESMITPEEKQVIILLERSGGEGTQSELVLGTSLSKVKVHRIVKRLESLGIVQKVPYGMTNKIILSRKLKED